MASAAGGTVQALRGVSAAFSRLPSSTVLKAFAPLGAATKPSLCGAFGASRRWRKVETVNWRFHGARCVASAASTAASDVVVAENDVATSSATTSGPCYTLHHPWLEFQFHLLAVTGGFALNATFSV